MDVGRSITYVFQDPQWLKKVAIGGVLVFIPIFGWLVIFGYFMRNVRQVAAGSDLPLPEWDDFGNDFMRGLKGFVAMLVWYLPVIVISICAIAPLQALSDNNGAGALVAAFQCVSSLVGIALAFFQPLVISRVAMSDAVGPGLDFAGIINEARANAVPLLIVLVMSWVLSFVASFGVVLCLIGVVFTLFLSYVMLSHLYGQVRRQIDLGAPVTTPAVDPTI